MLESLKIVAFATLAAIVYGILHDQVTAHICVEYFTMAHPPVFPTESPFWLAVGWGIIATWWVGLPLGGTLALAARVGRAPKLALRPLRGQIINLMTACWLLALVAGLAGGGLQLAGVDAVAGWEDVIPDERLPLFAFAAWAHSASYIGGAIGGLIVILLTIRQRIRQPLPR